MHGASGLHMILLIFSSLQAQLLTSCMSCAEDDADNILLKDKGFNTRDK